MFLEEFLENTFEEEFVNEFMVFLLMTELLGKFQKGSLDELLNEFPMELMEFLE